MLGLAAYSDSDDDLLSPVAGRRQSSNREAPDAPIVHMSRQDRRRTHDHSAHSPSPRITHASPPTPMEGDDDETWQSPPRSADDDDNARLEPPPPKRQEVSASPRETPGATPTMPRTESNVMVHEDSVSDLPKHGKDIQMSPDPIDEHMERVLLEATASQEGTPASHSQSSDHEDSPAPDLPTNKEEVVLLPEPNYQCDAKILDKFERYFAQKARGVNFNKAVQSHKDFRNPSIYDKLVSHFELNEAGTNFDKGIFDPNGYTQDDMYDRLAEKQKIVMDRLEDKKKGRRPGNAPSGAPTTTSTASRDARDGHNNERKSKWQVGKR